MLAARIAPADFDGFLAAEMAAHRAERARRSEIVMERILRQMRRRAAGVVCEIVKDRARVLIRRPEQLAAIPGLVAASSPAEILAACAGSAPAARLTGFGGEVPAVNRRAACVYARWLRRVGRRHERAVIEMGRAA